MTPTIWHNPRCSKSRQTLALLQEQGHAPSEVLYLKDTPSEAEIAAVRDMLGGDIWVIVRKAEPVFKELGLSKTSDPQTVLAALAQNPILIERPIVIANGRAAIGRPPEAVLDIL